MANLNKRGFLQNSKLPCIACMKALLCNAHASNMQAIKIACMKKQGCNPYKTCITTNLMQACKHASKYLNRPVLFSFLGGIYSPKNDALLAWSGGVL